MCVCGICSGSAAGRYDGYRRGDGDAWAETMDGWMDGWMDGGGCFSKRYIARF